MNHVATPCLSLKGQLVWPGHTHHFEGARRDPRFFIFFFAIWLQSRMDRPTMANRCEKWIFQTFHGLHVIFHMSLTCHGHQRVWKAKPNEPMKANFLSRKVVSNTQLARPFESYAGVKTWSQKPKYINTFTRCTKWKWNSRHVSGCWLWDARWGNTGRQQQGALLQHGKRISQTCNVPIESDWCEEPQVAKAARDHACSFIFTLTWDVCF